MPVGTDDRFYRQVCDLQKRLKDTSLNFGLLLWEDVIRQMIETRFQLPGVNVDDWRPFTEALYSDTTLRPDAQRRGQ
jgi:hypothetical protein